MATGKASAQLKAAASKGGLSKALDLLSREARSCAYMTPAQRPGASDRGPGASRIGGLPGLPKEVDWPHGLDKQGRPWGHATFLVQINLADLPPIDGLPLPRAGVLALFSRSWTRLAVVFTPDPKTLRTRKPPTESEWGFQAPRLKRAVPLRFSPGVSLPLYRKSMVDGLLAAGGDIGALMRALAPEDEQGRVGGCPVDLERDPFRVMAFHQLGKPEMEFADYWDTLEEFEATARHPPMSDAPAASIKQHYNELRPQVKWVHKHRDEIDRAAAEWRLLCGLKAGGEAGLFLGDGMALSAYIRTEDLAAGHFDRVKGECPMVL